MPWNRPLIIGLLLVVLTLTWWRLQPDGEEVRRSRIMMGTVVEIMAAGQNNKTLEAAVEAAGINHRPAARPLPRTELPID